MRERQATRIFVKAPHGGLESVLARTLAAAFGESVVVLIGDPETEAGGDIVVTTDGASSPTEVSDLTENGQHVVVLAALPDEIAEASYRHAGARAYLPMVAAVAPLVGAVAVLVTSLAEGSRPTCLGVGPGIVARTRVASNSLLNVTSPPLVEAPASGQLELFCPR